jgi:Uncharacterized ACR, COG1993
MKAARSTSRSSADCAGQSRPARAACAESGGFHGDHPPHGDRFLQLRRHVPVVTITVDTPERIVESVRIIVSEQGLVTSEMVPAMSAMSAEQTVGGLILAEHDF